MKWRGQFKLEKYKSTTSKYLRKELQKTSRCKDGIKAARQAFDSSNWSELDVETRANYLEKIADQIEAHEDEL